MPHIIGVKFRSGGKSYYFTPGAHQVRVGDAVVVETSRGVEYGTISYDLGEVEPENKEMHIREIMRKATPEDEARAQDNRRKEKEAYAIAQEKIIAHALEMKIIDVEYTFDNNKILFYFTADGRIDFRELVKDLAGVFRTRIELRQIGVRDETKLLGGMGICGRPLCCHAYLSDFIPVSIKMAKEQGLSLNPGKISGVCGRLMCCLKNEEEVYEEINSRMPSQGDYVVSKDGIRGEVATVNILRETVRVVTEEGDEKEVHEVSVNELTEIQHRRRRGGKNANAPRQEADAEPVTANDLKELKQEEERDQEEGITEHRGRAGAMREHGRRENAQKPRYNGKRPAGGRRGFTPDHLGQDENERKDHGRREHTTASRQGTGHRDDAHKGSNAAGGRDKAAAGRERHARHKGHRTNLHDDHNGESTS